VTVGTDAAAENTEVLEAIKAAIPGSDVDTAVKASRTDVTVIGLWAVKSGQQIATVRVPAWVAAHVSCIRIGWVTYRVRARRAEPERCFLCHGYGHISRGCMGPDLSEACRRFGEVGHLAKACEAGEDRCVACDRAGLPRTAHRPGSGLCGARRKMGGDLSRKAKVNLQR